MGYGTITAHALMSLEARGTLFVTPGMETYDGMIVGEHSRDTDLDVNPVRTKELTNVRAACKDENVRLSPPRLMTLEEAIGYVASDEFIEQHCFIVLADWRRTFSIDYIASSFVAPYSISDILLYMQVTPKAIRLRKRYLDVNKRKAMSKKPKE
ncbi:hypothetical protein GH714_031237 [Hevea brasiliensis]|uniref:TypA/BipA C-terminal domain-containing protein n=1 Tax=Hevea brasiliensis TaxID=3981 RepID=A0A6A6L4H8_HEVBR|nr:hypothetical protein GH714_031237 [Hevea brasiliensis]